MLSQSHLGHRAPVGVMPLFVCMNMETQVSWAKCRATTPGAVSAHIDHRTKPQAGPSVGQAPSFYTETQAAQTVKFRQKKHVVGFRKTVRVWCHRRHELVLKVLL